MNQGPQTALTRAWEKHPVATSLGIALFGWALSMFFYFSWVLYLPENQYRVAGFLALCANPLARDVADPILYYRLTTPLLAYVLHLPPMGAIAVQHVFSVLNMAAIFALLSRRFDPSLALWAVIGLSGTTVMIWSNLCPGYPDSVSHTLATLCLFGIHPGAYIPLVFFGLLNDERMLFALPFIVLWKFPGLLDRRADFLGAARHSACMVAGILVWLLVRFMLASGIIGSGFEVPPTYGDMAAAFASLSPYGRATWPMWFWNVFMAYRWFWVLLAAGLLARGTSPRARGLAALVMGVIVVSSYPVGDASRTIAFAFIGILCALGWTWQAWGAARTRRVVIALTVLLYLTPVGYFVDNNRMWLSPPAYKLVREFMADRR